MLSSVRNVIIGVVLIIGSWIGWNTYNYYFDMSAPTVEVVGIEQNGHYAGDMNLVIKGSHSYKIATISVWLDGKSLNTDYRVNRASFDRPLQIPTKTLPQGKHTLKIELVTGTHVVQRIDTTYEFFVDNLPLQAGFINTDQDHKVFQGRTLHIQFQTNKVVKQATVQALSKEFICVQENENSTIYECFVPIPVEETPNEYPFVLTIEDHVGQRVVLDGKFQIMAYPFKKHVLRAVNQEQFAEELRIGKPQEQFNELMEQLTKDSPQQKLWRGTFYVPLNMTAITVEFGVKRVSQERGCYVHAAIDLVGQPKCVVWADADGIVVCKDRFGVTGNTVVIDHGCGVLSMLCHLESFAQIQVGDKIKRGQPVGRMGRTGYATGDHLHWELRINNIPVDPMQWTKTDF